MFNGVSGLHEWGTLVIPWVVVLLLTFGSTGATAIRWHVSYSDDCNAPSFLSEQPKQHLLQISCFLCVLSLGNYFIQKGVSCKEVDRVELAQDIIQWHTVFSKYCHLFSPKVLQISFLIQRQSFTQGLFIGFDLLEYFFDYQNCNVDGNQGIDLGEM
jgi:hypothetical protein